MIETQKLLESVEQLKELVAHQNLLLQTKDEQIKKQDEQLKYLDQENEILREALRLTRMARFAAHSEKLPSQQSELFNEAETYSSDTTDAAEDVVVVPAHKRSRGKRKPLPDHLPREEVIIDIPESEKICAKHGVALNEIGREVSEKLDIVPAKIKVIRTIRIKYSCQPCEQEGQSQIKVAPMPETILPKSNATAGLLAYIATSKYIDALPLYRLEQIFLRHDIDIPRNTMCRWLITLSEKLMPIYNLMQDDLLASDYVCCDETTTQVLKEDGKTPQSQSYMWVRTRHGPTIRPIVLFDYDPTRSKEVPKTLLKEFKGYLQADGFASYDEVCRSPDITRVGCLAHVRRKFLEAHKTTKKNGGEANRVLQWIQKLYKIEDDIKEKYKGQEIDIVDRQQARIEKAVPVLNEIKSWLNANQNEYPGLMGKAITYATNQWEYILNYLKDGRLSIDNNFTENRIRPFAVGRKNWLFSDSVAGAKASALLYSILQTARGSGLEPFAYMKHLLTELPACQTVEQIEKLLPHKIEPKTLD